MDIYSLIEAECKDLETQVLINRELLTSSKKTTRQLELAISTQEKIYMLERYEALLNGVRYKGELEEYSNDLQKEAKKKRDADKLKWRKTLDSKPGLKEEIRRFLGRKK